MHQSLESDIMNSAIRYLVFDIESVADGTLVSKLRYPGEGLSAEEAVARYRAELMKEKGTDFIPYTFQIPVSVVVGKVTADFRLMDVVAIDDPEFRPHEITKKFWAGWERYDRPTLVSFNGRGFDIPLLELTSFRYGIEAKGWFSGRGYDAPRNRFNSKSHIDLCELMTNFGASRFNGGLNLAANLLGKPGKMDVKGDMVQDMYQAGELAKIQDYCRCDVLDTYFVFLRSQVMMGALSLDDEQRIVAATHQWLIEQAENCEAFSQYLEHWGDWHNPWIAPMLDEQAEEEPAQEEPVSDQTQPAATDETPSETTETPTTPDNAA